MTYPPTWDFNKHGKLLEGTYVGAFHGIGRWKNTLYAIKDKSGKTWTIWGTGEIKRALQLRPFGKKIRLQFLRKIKDKKHTSGILHFKINVGKGNGEPDLKNDRGPRKKRATAAARHSTPRQISATPLISAGRVVADASAAKFIEGEKRKRGRPKKKVDEAVGVLSVMNVTEPPPPPPPGYGMQKVSFDKEAWLKRLKKI